MAIGDSAVGSVPPGGVLRRRVVLVALQLQTFGAGRLLLPQERHRTVEMRIPKQFSPIEVGEVDNFAFDFTRDMANEDIIAVQWSCHLTPFSSGADPDPGSRVPSGDLPGQYVLYDRRGDGSLRQKVGFFAVAAVGPMPASAAGGTYVLGARVFTSSGRQIALNSTVKCVLPGQ